MTTSTSRPRFPLWVVIPALGVAAGLIATRAEVVQAAECNLFSDCLGNVIEWAVLLLMTMVLTVLVLLLVRAPKRDLWTGAVFGAYGLGVLYAIRGYTLWNAGFKFNAHAYPAPWWILVPVATLVMILAWITVRAGTPSWLRIGIAVLIAAFVVGTGMIVDRAHRADTAARAAAVPMTYYLPQVPGSRLSSMMVVDQYIHLSYEMDALMSSPSIYLTPASGRATCAVAAERVTLGLDVERCTGDEFTSTVDDYTAAVLRRGDTVLVAFVRSDSPVAGSLLEILRNAEETTPERLANATRTA